MMLISIRILILFLLFTSVLGLNEVVSTTSQNQQNDEHIKLVPQAAERIRNEPESVWVEFVQLALEHKPLNLGQGFPDFAAPDYLIESLRNLTPSSRNLELEMRTSEQRQQVVLSHQYTRSFGHPRLVQALLKYYSQFRGFREQLKNANEQVLVTVGAYEALFCAIMAFVNEGDEVLIVDPAFDAYAPMVAMAGGKSVFVPLVCHAPAVLTNLSYSTEYCKLNMTKLEEELSRNKSKAIVLNTPNNPLGKMYTRNELEQVARLCIKYNLLVVADEVYEQFYYDTNEHVSIASLPRMWERTITIGSAGKTFSVTGWKVGWAFGPRHLINYMQLIHQTAVYTVATPLQESIARALEHEMKLMLSDKKQVMYWHELRSDLLTKRNRMVKIIERANMTALIPQGGYFMLVDVSNLKHLFKHEYRSLGRAQSNKSTHAINTDDYLMARYLSRHKHLQGIPGSAFYSDANKSLGWQYIRLCFIKKDETLDAFEQLVVKQFSSQTGAN